MPAGLGITGSLVLIAAGAFVLGHALSGALRAPPAKPAAFARPGPAGQIPSPGPVAQAPLGATQASIVATSPAHPVVGARETSSARISATEISSTETSNPVRGAKAPIGGESSGASVVPGARPANAQAKASPAPADGSEPPAATPALERSAEAPTAEPDAPPATSTPAVSPPPVTAADKAMSAPPDAVRSLGFLAQVKDLSEAVAAIRNRRGDNQMAEAAAELDQLIPDLLENRANPTSWSNLADALARAGQRSAAIAVANRGMNAAKRQQDGEAVTRSTQQLAQLELTGAQPAAVAASASAKAKAKPKGLGPAAAAAAAVAVAAQTPAPAGASSEQLSAALDEALRRSAATEALAILQQMADGSIARGDYAAALKAYNDAIQIAHIEKLTEVRADQYANVGRLYWKKGDKAEAEAFWRAARDQYEQFEITSKVAEMNALLAKSSPNAASSPSRPIQNGKRTSSFYSMR